MSAASKPRVLAMLKRLSPSWPSTDSNTSVGKELSSIAEALAYAVDSVDAALNEVLPDTTSALLERWEKIVNRPTRGAESDAARQARVLSVLRRTRGPKIAALSAMLTEALDLVEDDIVFVEVLRSMIDSAMADEIDQDIPINTTVKSFPLGKPWPGIVDDFGVQLTVESDVPEIIVSVISPSGKTWSLGDLSLTGYGGSPKVFDQRDLFKGDVAGGRWRVEVSKASGSATLNYLRLLVSNDLDSAHIYNFFVFRDPALAGTPDIGEAQRLFARTAHGHNNSHVIERLSFTHGDARSLHGREPHGDS